MCYAKAWAERKGPNMSSFKGKEPSKKPQVHAAKVEEVINDRDDQDKQEKEQPPAYDMAKIEAQIWKLSAEDRQEIMHQMATMEEQDF